MRLSLLFLVILINISSLSAQWSPDPLINTPICTESFKQKEIRVDSDSDGGAFIVWRDYRTGSINGIPDIYIQKVDSNGYAEWTLNGAEICVLPSNQGTPAITTDEKGGMIIAWTDRRNTVADIYAQRIDASGNILWPINGIPVCNKPNSEHSPKIVSDDNSGIIVVWEDQRWDADSTYNIWAQRIDSSGNPVWANGGIPLCTQDSNRINHKMQRDGEGGAIFAWQDQRTGDFDIWGQHLDANGNYLWGANGKAICIAPGVQTNPKIDPEKSADGVFVAWIDKRNGIDYDIFCNRIDSLGNSLWGAGGKPVVQAVENQSALDILSNNKTQGVIISWKDKRSSEYDIYVQKLDFNGDPVWDLNGLIVCDAISEQLNPNIISDKNGGALIVWQDERSFDWDIYGQRVSYNGNMIWDNNGIPICLATGDQTSPKNIPDNKGGMIIAWEDKRNGFSKDIYIHHILIEDTVTYPIDSIPQDSIPMDTVPVDTIPVDTTVGIYEIANFNASVYPNPFSEIIHIDFTENLKEPYTIKVVDAIGNLITDFSRKEFSRKNIKLDLSEYNLSEGIYFLLITSDDKASSVILRK